MVDGRYFIDRDPDAFKHILALLRAADPSIYIFPDEYKEDLEFYCMDIEPILKSEVK